MMMLDQENQPLLSTSTNNDPTLNGKSLLNGCTCSTPRRVCQRYKALLLILAWTVIVGELLMLQQIVIWTFINNYVPVGYNHFANSVSSPLAFAYAILAVIAMFYPLGGFLADVCCGRFKTVMVGLSCLLLYIVIVVTIFVWIGTKRAHPLLEEYTFEEVAPFYFVGFGMFTLAVMGIIAFQANFIQLGLDQLMDAPSKNLSVFVHVAIWADVIGTVITGTSVIFGTCPGMSKVACYALPLLTLVSFPLLLIFSCCKHQWFYIEPVQRNPYKNILRILNFVRKHKYPLQHSAFTYCGGEGPSRIDLAKSRFGGPFTTEQVEDVKTFLRILILLLSLGAFFVMEIPTSYIGFTTFGQHTGYKEDFINRCTIWTIFESSLLQYIIRSIFLPIYIYVIFVLINRHISMFTRLYVGLFFYILGTVSMLAIDLTGHLHSANDLGAGSHCMFAYTRDNNTARLTYPTFEMHWAVLIPPNILLGMDPPIVMATIFEFITAQSPSSMKGFLIGVFFAIKGFFQLISSIALVPISSYSIWYTGSIRGHPPVTNCGFTSYLFTIVVALFGLVVFSIVVKWYKYRERDDRPYNQSVVEEIFYQRSLMNQRSETPDYGDLDT